MVARVKTWTNETLYPADLNAEFDNILNNMVDTSTAQTITGRFTFTGGIVVNEILSASGAGHVKLGEWRWDPGSGTLADADGFYWDWTGDDDGTPTETIYARDGVEFSDVQAGAGIVNDSNPRKEYQETINKAKAQIKAIELAHY